MPNFNDGSLPYGSQVWNINGTSFVAENITWNSPSTTVEQFDEDGEPSKQVSIDDFESGTASLQVPTAGSYPAKYATFTANVRGANVNCYVSEVGDEQGQRDATMTPISFRRVYN